VYSPDVIANLSISVELNAVKALCFHVLLAVRLQLKDERVSHSHVTITQVDCVRKEQSAAVGNQAEMERSKKEAAKTKIRMREMRKRKEAPLVPDSTVLTP